MGVYNENRDNNNSIHDEIREQNAKLKNASFKEKLAYFKEYYLKTTIIIVIAAIAGMHIIYSMVTAPKDTAFSAYFFNNSGYVTDNSLIDNFASHMDIDSKKHSVFIDSTIYLNPTSTDFNSVASVQKTAAAISTNDLDIIAGDTTVIDFFAKDGYFYDVTELLPEETCAKFADNFYYAKNDEDKLIPVGIYVKDAPMLKKYNYYTDQEPVLCFVINSNSIDNAIEFFNYIYTE